MIFVVKRVKIIRSDVNIFFERNFVYIWEIYDRFMIDVIIINFALVLLKFVTFVCYNFDKIDLKYKHSIKIYP